MWNVEVSIQFFFNILIFKGYLSYSYLFGCVSKFRYSSSGTMYSGVYTFLILFNAFRLDLCIVGE